jgi:hypothetical protein
MQSHSQSVMFCFQRSDGRGLSCCLRCSAFCSLVNIAHIYGNILTCACARGVNHLTPIIPFGSCEWVISVGPSLSSGKRSEVRLIRRSPNGVHHARPQPCCPGRHGPEQVVVIHRKRWSPSTGNPGRHGPARALDRNNEAKRLDAGCSARIVLKSNFNSALARARPACQ